MSIVTEPGPRLEALRSHGRPAERVDAERDPARAIRALTERITAILQES